MSNYDGRLPPPSYLPMQQPLPASAARSGWAAPMPAQTQAPVSRPGLPGFPGSSSSPSPSPSLSLSPNTSTPRPPHYIIGPASALSHPAGVSALFDSASHIGAVRHFSHVQHHFRISASIGAISRASAIADMEARLDIRVPEMIYGDNLVRVMHVPSGWQIEFTAEAALDTVDKLAQEGLLQVAHAKEWSRTRVEAAQMAAQGMDVDEGRKRGGRHGDVGGVIGKGNSKTMQIQNPLCQQGVVMAALPTARPFDWSWSCRYLGTESRRKTPPSYDMTSSSSSSFSTTLAGSATAATTNDSSSSCSTQAPVTSTATTSESSDAAAPSGRLLLMPDPAATIPIELLSLRDPILFYQDVVLYESELDDNGISLYSVKVRVHEQRMLLLARLFMRVDKVVVRLRDLRVYVDFLADHVVREYTEREKSWDELLQVLPRGQMTHELREANSALKYLPLTRKETHSLSFKSCVASAS